MTGQGARANIQSVDDSTSIAAGDIFKSIELALEEFMKDENDRRQLAAILDKMKSQQGKPSFASAYQKFIAHVGNHITVISPFLPSPTKLLSV